MVSSQVDVPKSIELIVSLCNSLGSKHPDRIRSWMTVHGFAGEGDFVDLEDVARVGAVGEAIRSWVQQGSWENPPPQAVEVINREGRRTPLRLWIGEDGRGALLAESPLPADRAVGSILSAVRESTGSGLWLRLKTCRDPNCGWVFFDRSRNRSGVWCEMAVCGNREKARRYKARRRAGRA